jgi:ribosomal protein S18 acetylase RimI-like enzyme
VIAAGLEVTGHPLLVLESGGAPDLPALPGVDTRLVSPEDDLALIGAVAGVAFGAPGTGVGPEGALELRAATARRTESSVAFERDRLLSGKTVMAAAFDDGLPVSVGSHNPVGDVSEIVGVGTLPAFRRRGFAAAVVRLLIDDARGRGVETIFLTADDTVVARLYAGLGFREIATAYVGEKT